MSEVFATANLYPRSGSDSYGRAWFVKNAEGLRVFVNLRNVVQGAHGMHIHEKGDCNSADASSAGDHYNPAALPHGAPNPQKSHAGDLGNVVINENGQGFLNLSIPVEDFHQEHLDWTKIIGKSLVLHALADDLVSQPSGASGARIACGVITRP